MINERFGRLIVLSVAVNSNSKNKKYTCKCDCGNTTTVFGHKLRSGGTKSCGCYAIEFRKNLVVTADLERRQYTKNSYTAMIGRCTNPKYPSYPRYGAKGIFVCDRWRYGEGELTGWLCFFTDMGPKPTGYSIDRVDNAKGYFPENCRWATKQQQIQNRAKTYTKRIKT